MAALLVLAAPSLNCTHELMTPDCTVIMGNAVWVTPLLVHFLGQIYFKIPHGMETVCVWGG